MTHFVGLSADRKMVRHGEAEATQINAAAVSERRRAPVLGMESATSR